MEELFKLLEHFGSLSEEDKQFIDSNLEVTKVPKGKYLLKAGQVCNKIYYLKSGILRIYFYDKGGSEFTLYFYKKGMFCVDLESFHEVIPSAKYIQAEVGSEVICFPRSAMEMLGKKISRFNEIASKITEKILLDKLNERTTMMIEDASTRYETFIKLHPDLATQVPIGHIASYLGISIYTLSRIRKNMMAA